MYGDNGNLHYENKPVIEKFKSDDNIGHSNYVKSIIKAKNMIILYYLMLMVFLIMSHML